MPRRSCSTTSDGRRARGRCGGGSTTPLPRRRLGGTGTPLHECSAYIAPFEYGIPSAWRTHGDYFTSGTPIDPADPPRYESESKYLLRLGLLLPGERERLCPRHFWPELVE
jgi:hypothetical protein